MDAVQRATLDVVRYLKENCAVEFNQSHVEAGVSALRAETVKYLIDSGVYANIDDLVAELAQTMEQADTLDWQDEDPHEVRTLHDQLRNFFREKLGITPEKDRLRLRAILSCVDSCRETMQSAEYLDICQYLKRLHKETGK
jgi:methylphosphotriester-DNA--protein-cysteine methyltransferase